MGTFDSSILRLARSAQSTTRTYPIVATAADDVVLARETERWWVGRERLLATLAAFDAPAIESMTGVGACPVAKATSSATTVDDGATIDPDAAIATRLILLPGEALDGLDVVARAEIDAMLAAADRGRFRTAEAHKPRARFAQRCAGGRATAASFSQGVAGRHGLRVRSRDGVAAVCRCFPDPGAPTDRTFEPNRGRDPRFIPRSASDWFDRSVDDCLVPYTARPHEIR